MKGIDISSGSGTIDFRGLKDAGYEFVICRAGYGSDVNQKDRNFDSYVGDALAAGLHVGAYWFIYARTIDEAVDNAKCFLEVAEGWRGRLDMPLYIDYEYDSTRYYEQETGFKERRDIATDYIRSAAQTIENAGYYAGIYLNPDYIKNHVTLSPALDKFALWLAQWGVDKPSYKCGLWQKSGDTRITQATGAVDLNECYVDYPSVIRRAGLNGFKADPTPQAANRSQRGDRWEIIDTGDGLTIKLGGKEE